MKNLYFILSFLFISSFAFSQSIFNNAGGDFKWSNDDNWDSGVPNDPTAKAKIAAASVIVDGDYTVGQIIFLAAGAGGETVITFTNEDSGTLTITGKGVSQPIQLNRNPQHAIFNLPVIFDSSENKTETWFFNTGNTQITFGEGHSFTVKDEITFKSKSTTTQINFNGTTSGAGNLKFATASNAIFGENFDGSSFTGKMIIAGDFGTANKVTLTSNVADGGTFLGSGASISVIKNGGTINVNGENTLKGKIFLTGAFGAALKINKNQSAVGTVNVGTGKLTITAPSSVSKIAFADSKAATWGTPASIYSVVINGATNNEVSFGSSATGLTATQLSQVSLNGTVPFISSSGELYITVTNSTFNGGGGDSLWSNASNWSAGIPTVDNAQIIVIKDLVVDSDKTVSQIKNNGNSDTSVKITATGGSKLTVTGADNASGNAIAQPFQNNKVGSSFIFDLPVIFDSDASQKILYFTKGAANDITFTGSLTLNDPLSIQGINNTHALNLNGSLLGSGNLIFSTKAQAFFGATYDGSLHTGDIISSGKKVKIVSRVSDDGTFLASANTIDIQEDEDVTIIIDKGVNTLKGNIKITGDISPLININEDQSAVGTITLETGTLNLTLPAAVEKIAFANNSAAAWGTGKLIISGAANKEVSFGNNASGLTAAQLSQITFNGVTPLINSSGELYTASVLVSTFVGGGGNSLWSNAANWSAGVPTAAEDGSFKAKATIGASVVVDTDVSVAQVKLGNDIASVVITATNNSVLTLSGTGVGQPIQNNSKNEDFKLDLPIVLNSSDPLETIQINGSGTASITFGENSVLTLTKNTKFTGTANVANPRVLNMNGTLKGTGQFQIGNASKFTFGSTSDNSSFTGGFLMLGKNGIVNVNTAKGGTFLKSGVSIETDAASTTGHTITINTENVFKGDIVITDNPVSLAINANQSAVGQIIMGSGTLNLALDAAVTSLEFADNSASLWKTGTLAISGAADDIVSFGTTASGLTAAQLSQVKMDGNSAKITSTGHINKNQAPVAVADTATVAEDSTSKINVIGNDTDAENETLSLTLVTAGNGGSVAVNADGLSVDYSPKANFNGTEVVTYTVSDGENTDATGTLTVTVTPVNDSPLPTSMSVTTPQDTAVEITLKGTDPDSADVLTFAIVTNPPNGSVTLVDNKATYVPNTGFVSGIVDTFTFKVNDGTVDSPVAATVSITVTSNDSDGDGVSNDIDECPNTPAGSEVNFKGCAVFSLPPNNNKVQVSDTSCVGTDDGSIALSVEDASNDYTISVTGQTSATITGSNTTASVTGLTKGTYQVCFKVDGQATYEQCFEAVIGEPAALSAFIDVDNDDKSTSISLGGSDNYNVEINGVLHQVKGNRFDTDLPTGLNRIRISTNLDCQGIIEKEIFISEDILYYPNPTRREVKVHVSGKDTKVMISVFSEKGDLIYSKEQEIQDMSRLTDIDLSRQISGNYIVVMESKTVRKTFKIIKR